MPIPWQHSFQQSVSLLLFFDQLTSSFNHQFFQVISVLFHHINNVVKNVCFPLWGKNIKTTSNSSTRA